MVRYRKNNTKYKLPNNFKKTKKNIKHNKFYTYEKNTQKGGSINEIVDNINSLISAEITADNINDIGSIMYDFILYTDDISDSIHNRDNINKRVEILKGIITNIITKLKGSNENVNKQYLNDLIDYILNIILTQNFSIFSIDNFFDIWTYITQQNINTYNFVIEILRLYINNINSFEYIIISHLLRDIDEELFAKFYNIENVNVNLTNETVGKPTFHSEYYKLVNEKMVTHPTIFFDQFLKKFVEFVIKNDKIITYSSKNVFFDLESKNKNTEKLYIEIKDGDTFIDILLQLSNKIKNSTISNNTSMSTNLYTKKVLLMNMRFRNAYNLMEAYISFIKLSQS